jgi:transcriptional regulator with XRE-family HTH domain
MEEWKQRLKSSRVAKNLNKTAFAKLAGVSNPTVTDWEKSVGDGGIGEITGPNLMKVCEVLGVDPDWLLTGKTADRSNGGGSADALSLTKGELALLAVYRRACLDDPVAQAVIDDAVTIARERLDAGVLRQHQG